MKKVTLIVCVILLITITSIAFAYSGSDYTTDSSLATKLDNLIQGKVAIFSNTSTKFPVGSSLNNSTQYYWKNGSYSGYQCYAYGNAAYYYLFGDVPFHGGGGYSKSKLISGVKGLKTLSYDILSNAGVGCGAYIRTTIDTSGAYSGNGGHSMIVLTYDKSNITVLHGNANGKGLVTITTSSWSSFNSTHLTGRNYRVSHIVQPNSTAGTITVPKPASSFSFQNVTYPKTFKINTSNGWNLGGGTLVCDKKLKTITTTITTADGKTNISGPKTYSNLNSYSYTIKNLDTMDGSNNGVRFSYIKNAGNYIWVLTATDEAGRTLMLSMPFTAVSSGSTATATKSVTYTSEIAYGFTTPASLKTIDSETFSGITAKSVRIAGKVTKIGSKAFANCSKLVSIYIPSSCTSIASDAFSGLSSLNIYGQSGSYAETFAKEKGFTFYPVLSFSQRIRQYILASDNEKVYNPALDLDGNGIINTLDYIEAAKTE